MKMWEFFRKKNNENNENKESIKNNQIHQGSFSSEIPKNEESLQSSKLVSNINKNEIPSPEQLDAISANVPIDISKLIHSTSTPDHKTGSIILSNIFLIPRNMKNSEDSWPFYQELIDKNKKIQLELAERNIREVFPKLKGFGKKAKIHLYDLLKEKREIMQNYYEEYQKTITFAIQKIRVDIIPLEKEISQSKYNLNNAMQKLSCAKSLELEKIKAYHQVLESNIRSLIKIKDTIKNVLSLKKLWHAIHIMASYILAFFGATEIVKSQQFKAFISDKLSKLSAISDFVNSNFIIVQGLAAAMVFLITVGMYDKFIIEYLKRRAIKKEISELVRKEKEYSEEISVIQQKIDALKEERKHKINSVIKETEQELEYLYEEYKSKISEIDRKVSDIARNN